MRTSAPLLAALVVTAASSVHADRRAPLATDDVRDRMKVVDDDVSRCYLGAVGQQRGAGHLEIKLSIHRSGLLDRIEVAAPGLAPKVATKVGSCIKTAVKDLAFPASRTDTVAIVPYFYQRTAAPDSGPQYSCWNPKGCH